MNNNEKVYYVYVENGKAVITEEIRVRITGWGHSALLTDMKSQE